MSAVQDPISPVTCSKVLFALFSLLSFVVALIELDNVILSHHLVRGLGQEVKQWTANPGTASSIPCLPK